MTVSSTTNRKTYAGDNTTDSFGTSPVVFFDTSDLVVYVVDDATGDATTLVENTDYTVSGGSGSTGTVDLTGGADPWGALQTNTTLVIVRDVPATQETDFANNDPSDAEVVEDALDRLTMLVQQNTAKAGRHLRQPDSDPVDIGEMPNVVDRASLYLAFDADGDPIASSGPVSGVTVSSFMETVLDDADAAAARSTLGISGTSVFSTGDIKLTLKTTADTGWVMMDDKSIGSAASAATGRANSDTSDLYALIWTNVSDTYAPVSSGRGASAAADFAANKTLTLPKTLGRALAVAGAGSGLTSRALGLTTGVETHQLVAAELPAHTHSFSATTGAESGHTHSAGSYASPVGSTGGVDQGGSGAPNYGATGTAITGTSGASSGHTHSVSGTSGSSGSDTAHQNMQPSVFLNVMVKL